MPNAVICAIIMNEELEMANAHEEELQISQWIDHGEGLVIKRWWKEKCVREFHTVSQPDNYNCEKRNS